MEGFKFFHKVDDNSQWLSNHPSKFIGQAATSASQVSVLNPALETEVFSFETVPCHKMLVYKLCRWIEVVERCFSQIVSSSLRRLSAIAAPAVLGHISLHLPVVRWLYYGPTFNLLGTGAMVYFLGCLSKNILRS